MVTYLYSYFKNYFPFLRFSRLRENAPLSPPRLRGDVILA